MVDRELTQKDLAVILGKSPRYIGQILSGKRKARVLRERIASILGISKRRLARLVRA
jgi:transcriptional regulator with XRE-family HTH domain